MRTAKESCVGDDRGLFTVQVNGQHDCVTDVQINYLNHGGGSKDADKLIDEIIANLAEQLQVRFSPPPLPGPILRGA